MGAATLKTIVRKNLILRLAVPRFFVQGDEVMISALVHNYLTTEKTVRVSLDVKGLDVVDGATRDVRVLPRAEARLDWRVRVQQVRSAVITGKALTDEESDALELELPVNIAGREDRAARRVDRSTPGGRGASISPSRQKVQPGSRLLAIRVAPSIAGSLFGALDYLTSFPYGCVEQTMSSFLPNIIVTQAVNDLGLKVNLDPAAVQQKIRAGLDRLYNFQHEDGGWGWWETDESHPFMTAYVVAGLVQAQGRGRRGGCGPHRERRRLGAEDPSRAIRSWPPICAPTWCTRWRSPASRRRRRWPDVYDKRDKLSPYGLAMLGLALEQVKDARAGELAAALEQSAKEDDEQAWWPATRDQMLDFSEDVTPEATAYAVKFLSHQRPNRRCLPKAALWLMNHRNEGYWWSCTKQTAMVIYGLTDYLKSTNELNPNLTATVFVNDQPVLTRKFDQATTLGVPELTLDESQAPARRESHSRHHLGAGRLYYSARAEYYSTDDKLQKTGTMSLNILRDYFRLVPGSRARRSSTTSRRSTDRWRRATRSRCG